MQQQIPLVVFSTCRIENLRCKYMTGYYDVNSSVSCEVVAHGQKFSTKFIGAVISVAVTTERTFHRNALLITGFPAWVSLNNLTVNHTFECCGRIRYDCFVGRRTFLRCCCNVFHKTQKFVIGLNQRRLIAAYTGKALLKRNQERLWSTTSQGGLPASLHSSNNDSHAGCSLKGMRHLTQ